MLCCCRPHSPAGCVNDRDPPTSDCSRYLHPIPLKPQLSDRLVGSTARAETLLQVRK